MNKDVKVLKYLFEKYGKDDILNAINALNESASDFNDNFIKLEMAVWAVLYSFGLFDVTYYMVRPNDPLAKERLREALRDAEDYIRRNGDRKFSIKNCPEFVLQDSPVQNRYSGDFLINGKYRVDLKSSQNNNYGSITFSDEADLQSFAAKAPKNLYYLSVSANGVVKVFPAKEILNDCVNGEDDGRPIKVRKGRNGYYITLNNWSGDAFTLPSEMANLEKALKNHRIFDEITNLYEKMLEPADY